MGHYSNECKREIDVMYVTHIYALSRIVTSLLVVCHTLKPSHSESIVK